ncbi:MAG TPA: hypothetical protein VMS56_09040 [Thermoanaerobaculia bacterium]|nr:hypothetical protein [Thermoanaerobaculia bacterium]
MIRSIVPLLFLLAVSTACSPEADRPAESSEAASARESTSTSSGYVDAVAGAQRKAKQMSAEEKKRVDEVNEAMKDQ